MHCMENFGLCEESGKPVIGEAVVTELHLDIELFIFKPRRIVANYVFMGSCR